MLDTTKLGKTIIDDFCLYHRYQETIKTTDDKGVVSDVANPETKTTFIDRLCKEYIKNSVVSYRANLAAETARTAEIAKEVVV